ncbi:MAG: single-stranded DNA-binding protein [Armatimonadota bacterium]
MNRVVLCGRLTTRPKRSYTPCGIAVAEFRLLVLREDPRDPTSGEEVDCIAFRQVAEELTDWGERSHRVNLEGRLRLEPLRSGDPRLGDARTSRLLKVLVERAYFVDPVKDLPASGLRAPSEGLAASTAPGTANPREKPELPAANAPGAASPAESVRKTA